MLCLCYASSWSKEASGGKSECKSVKVLKRWQDRQSRYRAGQERGNGTRAEQKGQKATPGLQQRHPYREGLELEDVIWLWVQWVL